MYIGFIVFQQDVCLGRTVSRSISIMDLASKKIKLVFWWANHWKIPLNLVYIKFARTWLQNIRVKSGLFPPTNWCAHQFWPHTCKWLLRLCPIRVGIWIDTQTVTPPSLPSGFLRMLFNVITCTYYLQL